ncbi:aldehyde ferredoxin oxidoreductase N-terminal domain-containing protein [Desulfospira joergensenii]|uniref:aldehyde ferredoxin oxidoreductase N-terminal domain-containing protein n=1 Tax=Desulfospira joergensenii TaxID=53329 RepID=UPI0003B652A6|nr:aldehyde ferredoxin oxidoreductase N-terminal domain-containing protein [Desulfospira joergensenii]
MEYLSTENILIIDLAAGEVEEEELEDSLVEEKIGGIGITNYLYEKYKDDDPIVLGTGLLTGTTYPASASGQITAKSPVTGKVSHCPVIYKVGLEIKYSGFDYIVVKGQSKTPVYLWIHDGVADITDAGELWGKDVWEATDDLRTLVGDDLLQTMLIGPAGEKQSDFAQVCCNHWNSPDRFGFGKLFGSKNLKGFAFRGMGMIEVAEPEDYVERSLEILKEAKENDFMNKKGIAPILASLGEKDVSDWIAPVTHRHSADYFTPYATITALFLDEDPGMVEESKQDEPGVLVSDIFALSSLKKLGLSAQDAGKVLKACAKYGIDPFAVATLSGKSTLDELIGSFDSLSGTIDMVGKGIFTPWCPARPIFNDFDLSGDDEILAWWERRQAVAMIFGIQPMFALMCPELTEENMLELASLGTELDLDQDLLDEVVKGICG